MLASCWRAEAFSRIFQATSINVLMVSIDETTKRGISNCAPKAEKPLAIRRGVKAIICLRRMCCVV